MLKYLCYKVAIDGFWEQLEKTFFVDVTMIVKEQEKETGMKNYNELDFTNDFLFCKILENNEELCKELLELILGKKVK